jgi:hypothetical protein
VVSDRFELLMISAMYENGGNTTQRFLDGHPELYSYPFESQPGTKYVNDHLTSLYPVKYRWPVFPLHDTPDRDYETIIDEECKVRIKTPQSSKFRDWKIELNDKERKARFVELMQGRERTRGALVEAYYRSTALAWKDATRSGQEHAYVGYSPIIVIDAEKILSDLPHAHVLQVVRNPWSAYADTKKRAVPLSIEHYMTGWVTNQVYALAARDRFPDRMHVVRYSDIIQDPKATLGAVLAKMGIGPADTLAYPSVNGKRMTEVYPWGTIRIPTPEVDRQTAEELSDHEKEEIRRRTRHLLGPLGLE